jgi:hypothetical protein
LPINLDAEQLAAIFRYIREHPEKAQSRRVEEFLELFSNLRDDLGNSERVRIVLRLRNLLSAYQWVVQISPTPQGFSAIHMIADRERLSRDDLWERKAVADLLKLLPYLGKRPRIRRCAYDGCKDWFFAAKREDQEFCKRGTCRQNAHDSDPEKRERKKLYMRELRLREKKRQEHSKKIIGFGSRIKVRAKKSVR